MDVSAREALEHELGTCLDRRDFEGATTKAIRGYGPEVLGFLCAIMRDEAAAADVFAQVCEKLWRGLPAFERRASLRTWLYTVARHAAWRELRRTRLDRDAVPLSAIVSRVQAEVRDATLPHLRSSVRDRVVELRQTLPLEDQALLILRVDKQLDWLELARVLHEDETLDERELKRESARLRKRFQLVKERLREQARAAGLIDDGA